MDAGLQTTEVLAVVVAVRGETPAVLTLDTDSGPAVPSGPLEPGHRSLQAGLREWVATQTGLSLGYVEQLYTFADRTRADTGARVISVSYLGLTRDQPLPAGPARWRDWYELLPWEDRRHDDGVAQGVALAQALAPWVAAESSADADRSNRVALAFGTDNAAWRGEDCLQRYELLWEAGLLPESPSGGHLDLPIGMRMMHDHRRVLATAMARLRGKIQYRPVVFELMPESFTLGQLQAVVEALAGTRLHKQNFRRLVANEALVEPTGQRSEDTGGRPAALWRFRPEVLQERRSAGVRLPGRRY